MFQEDNVFIEEDINDDDNFNENNIMFQNMAQQYGQMINNLRNENTILKYNLNEQLQLINHFQKISIEAQEKIDKLIKENKKIFKENEEMKEKINEINNQTKENKKKESLRIKDDLNSIKEEINQVHNFYSNQLIEKENVLNNLKTNYDTLEGQYQETLKSTINTYNNTPQLSNINSKSHLFDNKEEKFSFYGNYYQKNCNNCS